MFKIIKTVTRELKTDMLNIAKMSFLNTLKYCNLFLPNPDVLKSVFAPTL